MDPFKDDTNKTIIFRDCYINSTKRFSVYLKRKENQFNITHERWKQQLVEPGSIW